MDQAMLLAQFAQDSTQLTALEGLLDEERKALEKNDIQNLDLVVQKKNQLLQEASLAGQRRDALLTQAGLPISREGIETLIARFPARSRKQLGQRWKQLHEQILTCQKKNIVNGTVIAVSLQSNSLLLDLLTGRSRQGAVYDGQGKPHSQRTQGGGLEA